MPPYSLECILLQRCMHVQYYLTVSVVHLHSDRREYLSKRQEEQNENIDTVEADLYLLASRLCLKPGSDEENVSRVNED